MSPSGGGVSPSPDVRLGSVFPDTQNSDSISPQGWNLDVTAGGDRVFAPLVPVQSVSVKVRMLEPSWGGRGWGVIDSWEIRAGHTGGG